MYNVHRTYVHLKSILSCLKGVVRRHINHGCVDKYVIINI